jgi:hypothetical protein
MSADPNALDPADLDGLAGQFCVTGVDAAANIGTGCVIEQFGIVREPLADINV